jgi:GNAT superfamily N-acetyltransferase
VGTYYLKKNQPWLGAHVGNAGYAVSPLSRGQGIGRAMCLHSILEARRMGLKALQFNLVVITNTVAVKLWQECGFQIVGTLPRAFNHLEKGMVDAYVMYNCWNNQWQIINDNKNDKALLKSLMMCLA